MNKVRTGNICKISTGKFDVNEGSDDGQFPFFTCAAEPLRSDRYSFDGEAILLAGNGANVGLALYYNGKFEAYQRTYVLTNFKAFPKYVFYFFKAFWKDQVSNKQYGSATNYIRLDNITDFEIPLPDLPIQKQIAQILEDTDRARQQRKAANVLTEQFLQSSFLHLFGDPVRNEKGWEKHSIRSLATKYSDGPFGSNLKSEHYANDGRLVIRLENIGVNQFKDSSRTYIPFEHFKKLEKHSCFPGDVIIGTMGEPNLRACILPNDFDVAINKADCVLFRPNKNLVISEYVSYLLNTPSFVKSVSNLVLGQTRGRISMGRLSTVEITVPPLPLQQHFASLVADAEILRQKQQQSERELEQLFQSLLQQYFGDSNDTLMSALPEELLSLAAEKEESYRK